MDLGEGQACRKLDIADLSNMPILSLRRQVLIA